MRVTLATAILLAFFSSISAQADPLPLFRLPLFHYVHAYVTGYNTVPEQTSPTPCIAASGANICGRTDVVACPRHISLGTYLAIRGVTYVCEDRLAKKYDSRFDISCDKDMDCPSQVTGWVDIQVFSEDPCKLPTTTVAAARPAPAAPPRVVWAVAQRSAASLRGRLHLARGI